MTRIAWSAALKPNVVLFSEYGAQLVHHYRVYGDCVSHGSLRGTFMAKLSDFTNRACAEARSVAKLGRDWSTESGLSPSRLAPSPLGPNHHTPDDDPPARKAARAVASATSPDDADVSSEPTFPLPIRSARRAPGRSLPDWSAAQDESLPVRTSIRVSVAQYSAPPAPGVCPFPSDRRRPILPVSLPLPHFATQDFTLEPDTTQSHSVATQLYPSSPGGPVVDPLL